jgi:hypothetical protein
VHEQVPVTRLVIEERVELIVRIGPADVSSWTLDIAVE